jgi:hypothetical protein
MDNELQIMWKHRSIMSIILAVVLQD